MTQDAIKKIEDKICKDGSLSEERKIELLNLLTKMKPEVVKNNTPISSRIRESIIRNNKYTPDERMQQKNKYKNF
jgi:hypothetical protein